MNREIKFLYYRPGIGTSGKVLKIDYDHEVCYLDDGDIVPFNSLELRQYTGLKDKNGREIYEGDIVVGYIGESEYAITSQVYFMRGTFTIGRYWKDGIHDWYSMENFEQYELEIIGNIYQHKELLDND